MLVRLGDDVVVICHRRLWSPHAEAGRVPPGPACFDPLNSDLGVSGLMRAQMARFVFSASDQGRHRATCEQQPSRASRFAAPSAGDLPPLVTMPRAASAVQRRVGKPHTACLRDCIVQNLPGCLEHVFSTKVS